MLMQELGRILQEDPNLCAMAMVDKRKYIISKWSASHSEPIDEDAVALFLCDENRGNLTDEQRAFAKERCARNLNSAIKSPHSGCFNAAR